MRLDHNPKMPVYRRSPIPRKPRDTSSEYYHFLLDQQFPTPRKSRGTSSELTDAEMAMLFPTPCYRGALHQKFS